MERRKFTREFKLEAVKLITERGVEGGAGLAGPGVHPTQLRQWVRDFAADPEQAFPGHGQMKAEQAEIRAAEARGDQAQGRTRHPGKSRGLLRAKESM